ncbi:AraC-type DNA-binding protein [Salegentibacter agarivorans]|uniref:AraC-type DNA-binding protein n=1 Tax=Salegentibacter agarivorans TaxID=345907 RepID=A0A1I2NWL2_9FLAO|nr:helix-turn-helix domain-containing protein [Salegentibacter agarivorans]SFG08305.1 AraC-type DNA-binding protein [Salegentibacter agarivorans]
MFHFEKNFGLFIGKLKENIYHKHYALQISVSAKSKMELSVKNEKEIIGKSFFINSKVEHKLISNSNQLTVLINPLSSIGHQLHLQSRKSNFKLLNENLSNRLIETLNKFETSEIDFEKLCELIRQVLSEYQCTCESENHLDEQRIINTIKYMDANFEKVLSLEEVAEKCFLSPTRFLHLFKEKTNLTFRRYQLWNKLIKSLPFLVKNSITETAYTFGFSDSSHYTRTFKETFGVTPKFLISKT